MDGDFDYRIKLSVDNWIEAEDIQIAGKYKSYKLIVPDNPYCDVCGIKIKDGHSAWLQGTWEYGVQTSNNIWCPPCYLITHPQWYPEKSESLWSRIKEWFRR